MVQQRDDVVLIDAAILGPPAGVGGQRPPGQLHRSAGRLHVLQAAVPARQARRSRRVSQLWGHQELHRGPPVQPDVQDPPPARCRTAGAMAYLRPETAQGMFTNFANVLQTSRKKPPFGIAQVGKSFRNEITPQNWIFRTREFEQMELEFFVPPADGPEVVRVLVRRARSTGTCARHPGVDVAAAGPRRRRAEPLLERHVRRGVLVPVGLGRARGHRPAHRLRPHPARDALGRAARLLRPGQRRAVRAPRDRARCGRHPHHGGVPVGGVRRGRRERRDPHRAAAAPAPGPLQGGRAAAVEEGHPHPAGPGGVRHSWPTATWSTTTRPRPSAAAIGARTRSGTPLCVTVDFDSLDDAPSRSATATPPSRCGCRSRPRRHVGADSASDRSPAPTGSLFGHG
jgi:hypothetical protein